MLVLGIGAGDAEAQAFAREAEELLADNAVPAVQQ